MMRDLMPGEPDTGNTFVNGKDPETARGLLNAAEALGLDVGVVRTRDGMFEVPDAVYDAYAATLDGAP